MEEDIAFQLKVLISEIIGSDARAVSLDFPLMGGSNPIDSVKLVEICVRLEDYASEIGFEFDWTSESAMSRSRSMFQTIGTLFDEFSKQMAANE